MQVKNEMSREEFLRVVEAGLKRNKISAARWGLLYMGDPTFVSRLRAGRTPRKETMRRALRHL